MPLPTNLTANAAGHPGLHNDLNTAINLMQGRITGLIARTDAAVAGSGSTSVFAEDDFAGPAGPLTAHAPIIGGSWVNPGSPGGGSADDFLIADGAAYAGGPTSYAVAYLTTGSDDEQYDVEFTYAARGSNVGSMEQTVMFGMKDDGLGYGVQFYHGYAYFCKQNSWRHDFNFPNEQSIGDLQDGDTLLIRVRGTTIELLAGGTLIMTLIDSTFNKQGKVGFNGTDPNRPGFGSIKATNY